MPSTAIRDLTQADLPTVARIHVAAFPTSALTSLGQGAVERYYAWQLLGPHQCAASGVEAGDRLVGFCFSGIFHGSLSGFLRRNRAYLAFLLLCRPWLLGNEIVLARARSALQILTRGKKKSSSTAAKDTVKSYGILAIAVDPTHQGSGAGKALMRHCEALAQKAGFTQMHLTVNPDNGQAIGFYERGGWMRVIEEGAWKGFMRKPLQQTPAAMTQT